MKDAVVNTLRAGGIVVVRTDTIYGIIAAADSEAAVEKVYEAKHRDPSKQCIVLIADKSSLLHHGDEVEALSAETPTSVIIPASNEPTWLLRGGDTIAYRLVRDPFLKSVIEAVGPVIAPSANPEGLPPARTIKEARAYFGDSVDYYVDGGEVPESVSASRIIEIQPDGSMTIIRSN